MNHAANPSLPAALGNAAVEGLARLIGAIFRLAWHNPLNTVALGLLAWGIAQGTINAVWMQTGAHPAPLFAQSAQLASASVPAERRTGGSNPQAHIPSPVPSTVVPAQQIPAIPATTAKPVEPRPAPAPITIPSGVGNENIARLQAKLQAKGLFLGKVDGYYGPQTASAIRAFERGAGLAEKGAVTPEIERAVQNAPLARTSAVTPAAPASDPIGRIAEQAAARVNGDASSGGAAVTPAARPTSDRAANSQNGELVGMVQSGLARLGFYAGAVTGEFSPQTARAIREFENYNNYPVTGQMAPELIDLLMEAGAYN